MAKLFSKKSKQPKGEEASLQNIPEQTVDSTPTTSSVVDGKTTLPAPEKKKEKIHFSLFKKKKSAQAEPQKKLKRVKASPSTGLTVEQVIERINGGYTNKAPRSNDKTYASIFFGNIFTFFNMLCLAFAIMLIVAGSFKNLFFMLTVTINTIIGIVQEIRAKRTIGKLSLLTAPTTKVLRGGKEYDVQTSEVVLDDVISLSAGKQIVADCILLEGEVEVNEALLTGESVTIKKSIGDTLLSGSFIASGACKARVDKIGGDCYIEKLSSKAKAYRKPKSELFNSLNAIIKVIGIIIIPIAIFMYLNNYSITQNWQLAIEKTAGSVIGMIPAGMFLLSSIALTVSVIRLAQQKALVQDLYCVEMLARVNVLCLDKTGTITDGTMKVYNCIELQNKSGFTLKRIVGSMLSALSDNNQTSQALINYFGYNKELHPTATLPFSSKRKLSAVSFEETGTYILGAPEFVMPSLKDGKIKDMMDQYAKDGYRVLLLASSNGSITKGNLPASRSAVAVIVLEDRIREDAIETIKWFKENDVNIKIISGDNPLTVAEIAKRVGVDNTENFINLEGMSEQQVVSAANKYTVFGRVTPDQKAILVKAMKAQGNTVAMTGDGVNDILAMKESDCSIAMASGSDAVRNVAHMVLLDSKFSSMPQTVREGRKVINNVQKSSSLFFMKTLFTIVFSIIILATRQAYPFAPLQLFLLETFIIGIPSFFLALRPNTNRVSGKFIYNVLKNAIPSAITLILNVSAVYLFVYFTEGTLSDIVLISSMSTIILTFTGLVQLYKVCKPYNVVMGILFATMTVAIVACILFANEFFEIARVGLTNTLFLMILVMLASFIMDTIQKIMEKLTIGQNNNLPKSWIEQSGTKIDLKK